MPNVALDLSYFFDFGSLVTCGTEFNVSIEFELYMKLSIVRLTKRVPQDNPRLGRTQLEEPSLLS